VLHHRRDGDAGVGAALGARALLHRDGDAQALGVSDLRGLAGLPVAHVLELGADAGELRDGLDELDGEPAGYAYASAFKSRAAYDWSVETSIYVSRDLRSSGVGSLLYEKLEEYLTAQHVCNVCACITYPNPPSIAFHEKHGYKTVAHFHASGYKQDAWHDMIWMEKTLCPHTIPPRPFIPFPELWPL
jgi:GNAT superfamily N-acetyltransferase